MPPIKTRHPDTEPLPAPNEQSPGDTSCSAGRNISMHADVAVWEDCCSCEAEPYWVEAFAEQEASEGRDDAPSEARSAAGRGLNR